MDPVPFGSKGRSTRHHVPETQKNHGFDQEAFQWIPGCFNISINGLVSGKSEHRNPCVFMCFYMFLPPINRGFRRFWWRFSHQSNVCGDHPRLVFGAPDESIFPETHRRKPWVWVGLGVAPGTGIGCIWLYQSPGWLKNWEAPHGTLSGLALGQELL